MKLLGDVRTVYGIEASAPVILALKPKNRCERDIEIGGNASARMKRQSAGVAVAIKWPKPERAQWAACHKLQRSSDKPRVANSEATVTPMSRTAELSGSL